MLLSGYGVELAIKSTEYKAVDDTKVDGEFATRQIWFTVVFATAKVNTFLSFLDSKTAVTAEEDEDEEVQGFFFGTLK